MKRFLHACLIRYLIFIIILSFSIQTASAQIKWSNPQPSGYICRKVVFADANNGFILNYKGDLIKTHNQGTTWEVDHNFTNMMTLDVYDSTVILAGYAGIIYISSDKGNTWQKKALGTDAYFTMADIVSRDTIFLVGTGKIYLSTNMGQTWQMLNYANDVNTFDFVNSRIGYVGSYSGAIYKTTDGGQIWQQITPSLNRSNSAILAVKFRNADTGYAHRDDDTLLKTTNGGITWTKRSVFGEIMTMSFPSDSVGYVAGEDGALYRTTDAGNTWNWASPTGFGDATGIYSLSFITTDTGFAVGHRGRILKTTNRGISWQPYAPTYTDVTALSFTGSNTGYATTWNNCYKTTDGAKTWNQLSLAVGTEYPNFSRFEYAHFFSPDTGFLAASRPARIYKTYNGGQTWKVIIPSGSLQNEYNKGLSFVNDSVGFLTQTTTAWYSLFKTRDRGETWKKVDSPYNPSQTFTLIHFLNEKTGYAVRYNLLYKTNDSAKTWNLMLTNDFYQIQALWFTDVRTGFIGYNGGLMRTTDSGRTWVYVNNTNYEDRNIKVIKFLNPKMGYFSSDNGAINQTVDSGKTWIPYGKAAHYECNSIAFSRDSLVYIGGEYGTIVCAPIDTGFGTQSNCSGSSFTFISEVAGFAYQWQVDTGFGFMNVTDNVVYSGATTNTLIVNHPLSTWSAYTYRCVISNFPNALYSRARRLKFQTQWTGAIDAAWEKPGNWSCCAVPDSNTDVVITSGTIVLHSNTSIRSLQLSPNVSLTVNSGFTIMITH